MRDFNYFTIVITHHDLKHFRAVFVLCYNQKICVSPRARLTKFQPVLVIGSVAVVDLMEVWTHAALSVVCPFVDCGWKLNKYSISTMITNLQTIFNIIFLYSRYCDSRYTLLLIASCKLFRFFHSRIFCKGQLFGRFIRFERHCNSIKLREDLI